MSLEELLRMKVQSKRLDGSPVGVSPDFRIAVQEETENGVRVIVHADGYDSETLDLIVERDSVRPAFLAAA